MPEVDYLVASTNDIGDCHDRQAVASMKIVDGPTRGKTFDISDGLARIGRAKSQEIQLCEDDSVSRENHALIGYVGIFQRFAIFDGGKANPVWVNDVIVRDSKYLESGDEIRIGETVLMFVIL